MSGDYSRKTFRPGSNYSGVLMQQGRVQLDADWNEQIEIGLRRQHVETVDTIGRAVVPVETSDGFRVELSAGALSIFPGRMYVDGLLAENHGDDPQAFYPVLAELQGTQPVPYGKQPFFPEAETVEPLPQSGTHLAYIDVWQREVTYVEQPVLVEPAVGVDTTARWQTVWQVKVLTLDPQDPDFSCGDQHDNWDDLIAPGAGRLSTAIVEPQEEENVCLVPTEGGYRALENRLYRVEIHDGGGFDTATFKWARHNASIATAVNEINGTELVVGQSQWDESRRFNQDDWVEITDDVRELSGRPGEIRRISLIDYASNTITLDSALPPTDFPTSPTNTTDPERHTRIKRWDQQNEVDLTTGLLTVTSTPFYLEAGIQINFDIDPDPQLSGQFKTGDYWLFYARSADASIELLDTVPPRGIHHHYARLAVLNFPDGKEDCRIHWPPLFADSCCCTVSVGDGTSSHGQFSSIQEAVAQMPVEGGKICVLPGTYEERIIIQGKSDITISGCGKRSRIVSPVENASDTEPVIRVENSRGIHLQSFTLESNNNGPGIMVHDTLPDPDGVAAWFAVEDIRLCELNITSGQGSAIRCDTGVDIRIKDNNITMRDERTEWPGMFVVGTQVLIENNLVQTELTQDIPGASAGIVNAGKGGIQIGGNADRVTVVNNHIVHGRGDGITLGSLTLVDDAEVIVTAMVASVRIPDDPCDPCAPPPAKIPPRFEIDDEGNPVSDPPRFHSAGALYDIAIEHNRIERMGRNGIGVVGYFDLDETDEFITVEDLQIGHNHIEDCLSRILPAADSGLEDDIGYGGIALSDTVNLNIHHNRILNNGRNHIDPICGIYVLHGEGVQISDNSIINNGEKKPDDTGGEKQGARSGIHIVYAIAPTELLFPENQKIGFPRQNGIPATVIHNNVVSHPVGRALTINALGPVTVTDNQLTSRGLIKGQASALASTVAILNLGVSNEFYMQLTSFSRMVKGEVNLGSAGTRAKAFTADGVSFSNPGLDDFRIGRYLSNGNVLFADNQVVLDEFDTKTNVALTAVSIMSLDDVSFNNNQCDYSLWGDFLIFPNFILAPSVRMADNRFKESFFGAFVSAAAVGLMNTTTDNQATHCLLVIGNPKIRLDRDNIVLADAIIPPITTGNQQFTYCELLKEQVRKTFKLGDRI